MHFTKTTTTMTYVVHTYVRIAPANIVMKSRQLPLSNKTAAFRFFALLRTAILGHGIGYENGKFPAEKTSHFAKVGFEK